MDIKKWQEEVEDWFIRGKAEKWPIFVVFARLVEEIGEIGKIMNVKEGFQNKNVSELEDEFGDVLFTLMSLANHYSIDLNDAMKRVIKKYNLYIKQ